MKITNFIIALIIVGVIASTFTLFIVDQSTQYDVTYDESELAAFDAAQELNALTIEIENKTNQQTTESGLIDIVGNFIGNAIDTLKIAKQSTITFNAMASSGADALHLPAYFKVAINAIIIILIIIGVIVAAMIKFDL